LSAGNLSRKFQLLQHDRRGGSADCGLERGSSVFCEEKEMSYRDIFGEVLADHHESPRNYGTLPHPTRVENGYNPLCGDKVSIGIEVRHEGGGEKLSHIAFEGEGCSICMASASIMSQMVEGKSVQEVETMIEGFRKVMQGGGNAPGMPPETADEDIVALYGIKRFPVRIKCALLPWTTLKKGIEAIHAR
jgi:nitrogen fixation NifU-like protein